VTRMQPGGSKSRNKKQIYAHFKPFQVIITHAGFSVGNLLTIRQPANQETETQLTQSL